MRYDSETSLYWMSVRAYDPTLGRFISHDPLGRTPLFFDASQPYAYGGNNPLSNTDPSGQFPSGAYLDGDSMYFRHVSGTHMRTSSGGGTKLAGGAKCDPNVIPAPTLACANWILNAKTLRDNHLKAMDAGGALRMWGSAAVEVAALAIAFFTKNGVIALIETAIDAAEWVSNAIPYIGQYLADMNQGSPHIYSILQKLAALLNTIAWLGQEAYGFVKMAGWVTRMALDGVILAIRSAGEGLPGVLTNIALEVFGGALSVIVNGYGYELQAEARLIFAAEDEERNMNLVDWCNQYGGGACGTLPTV